jgi:hypothetical protein
MTPETREWRSTTRSTRTRSAVLLMAIGTAVAVGGAVVGAVLALQVRRTCADDDVYRLINLFCQHVHRAHPHLVSGLTVMASALIVGSGVCASGWVVTRRGTRQPGPRRASTRRR